MLAFIELDTDAYFNIKFSATVRLFISTLCFNGFLLIEAADPQSKALAYKLRHIPENQWEGQILLLSFTFAS